MMMVMMRVSTVRLWLQVPAILLAASAASAFNVTLGGSGPSNLRTYAAEHSTSPVSEISFPEEVPYQYISSSVDGVNSAVADYDLSTAELRVEFDLARGTTEDFSSWSSARGSIFFSVDEDVNFSASGSHVAIDPLGTEILLRVYLFDQTLREFVFDSHQNSQTTPHESFALGLSEGDAYTEQVGPLTGTLIAGNDYRLYYLAGVEAPAFSATSATSSGHISLEMTPIPELVADPVPSLGSLGLVVVGSLLGVFGLRELRTAA